MLKKEREDWKKKTNVCASEWQALKVKVTELQEQLAQQEQSYTKLQTEYQNMQDKYKNAKKTVYTYKENIVMQPAHMCEFPGENDGDANPSYFVSRNGEKWIAEVRDLCLALWVQA
ncbi:hypothetical protein RR48_00874 [Papilio machaon]|uniref:Uncharacterized protein n=1 Tax=Papilio machaon TaxID=76193 RepID=A0A0N1IAN1_PAPMA|nr:hypothetical protein RR48_00874 [Papilio machaon]